MKALVLDTLETAVAICAMVLCLLWGSLWGVAIMSIVLGFMTWANTLAANTSMESYSDLWWPLGLIGQYDPWHQQLARIWWKFACMRGGIMAIYMSVAVMGMSLKGGIALLALGTLISVVFAPWGFITLAREGRLSELVKRNPASLA